MSHATLWILPLLLLLAGVGLARDGSPGDATRLPAAYNAFAWDLYAAVKAGEENLFFSPFSVSTALTMTREGARGETAKAMDDVLHLAGVTPSEGFRLLARNLTPPIVPDGHGPQSRRVAAYEFHVANRLWGQEGFAFEDAFTQLLAGAYHAPLARVDFRHPEQARRRINAWVEKQTQDKIKDLIPPGLPSALTRLVLANAIYFKAPWAEPFSEGSTVEGDFLGAGGKKLRAPLMHQQHRFRYADLGTVQALELPYRGHATSMVILLPKAKDGLGALETAMCAGELADWSERLSGQQVDVKLPRFEFTQALNLTETLKDMGMALAFHPTQADFSGMTTKPADRLCVGAVLHKAFVAVDEKGTEAAAATAVMMELGAAPGRPDEPVSFHADHPFLFLIRHNATGTVLFLGRVTKP